MKKQKANDLFTQIQQEWIDKNMDIAFAEAVGIAANNRAIRLYICSKRTRS